MFLSGKYRSSKTIGIEKGPTRNRKFLFFFFLSFTLRYSLVFDGTQYRAFEILLPFATYRVCTPTATLRLRSTPYGWGLGGYIAIGNEQ